MHERVRQYIAGRTELITGDRLVLRALTERARERQRFVLGVPLTVIGLGAVLAGVARLRAREGTSPGVV